MTNFKKYFAITLLLVILVLPTFVSAAWWNPFSWNIWQKIANIFQKAETAQVQQEKKIENIKTYETVGWQTYQENDFDFNFKYPKGWEVYDDLTLNTCCLNITNYGRMKSGRGYLEKGDIKIQIAQYKKSSSVSLKDFVSSQTYMESDIKATVVNELEIAGIKAVYSNLNGDQYYLPQSDTQGILINIFNHPESKEGFKGIVDKFLSTFKFTKNPDQGNNISNPIIESISPQFGPRGTTIEVRGKNLLGFEGDRNLWIENNRGIKGIIYGDVVSTSNYIKASLNSPLCQTDESYRGLPCASWLELTPGIYKIYANPWGKKTNVVNFEITK